MFSYRYPSKYLDIHFHKFFNQHLPTKSLIPIISSTNQFFLIRDKLFAQPSVKETQMTRRITNVETREDKKRELFEKNLFIHYTHENRLEPLKRDIHQIYSDVFHGTEASSIRLIIGHLNSSNIASELIQTRPYPAFVKLKPLPSTTLPS